MRQSELVFRHLATTSHSPPISPRDFANPNLEPAELGWASTQPPARVSPHASSAPGGRGAPPEETPPLTAARVEERARERHSLFVEHDPVVVLATGVTAAARVLPVLACANRRAARQYRGAPLQPAQEARKRGGSGCDGGGSGGAPMRP